MKWWEKTVEYSFIVQCVENKKLHLAPLDGNEERAGDTILSKDNKWLLIEFKRDKNYLKSEKIKFPDYSMAWTELHNRDDHHLIIFGLSEYNTLLLEYRTYFSSRDHINFEDIFFMGTDINDFKDYVEKLIAYKKPIKGSSGLNIEDYSLVASIDNEGDIVECKSLNEFCTQDMNMNLDQEQEQIPTQRWSGPSL